jgi:hypothetical protein
MSRTTSHAETAKTGTVKSEGLHAAKAEMLHATIPAIDYQAIAAASGTAMQAVIRASDAMLKGMVALNREMPEFANARLRENVERSGTLLRCTDPASAFNLQFDFARKATQQYLEEANRLMALATQMSGKCWEPIEECAKEALGRLGDGAADNGEAGKPNGGGEK